jgi:uncharacterized membrane protein YeaQ/YmgE (transglycosylase-associated protein family)
VRAEAIVMWAARSRSAALSGTPRQQPPMCYDRAAITFGGQGPIGRSLTLENGRRAHHMGFLIAIIIGGIIGWLASMIMKTNAQMGLIANIVVGIVGSVLGQWLAGALGIAAFGSIGSFLISLVGAVILIAILRALGVFA